jgi:hypothetical protein
MPKRSMAKCLYTPCGSASGPQSAAYDTRMTASATAVSTFIVPTSVNA